VGKYPTISDDPRVQKFYAKVRRNLKAQAKREGKPSDDVADHRFAEMLALKQTPKCMTDREFFAGMGTLDQQFKHDPQHLKVITDAAKKQGYTPSPNDVYMPGVAKFPGDKDAFISPSGGRGQLRKAVEKHGTGGEGAVSVKTPSAKEDPRSKAYLAPDVMNRLCAHEARKLKREGKTASQQEVKEMVLAKNRYKM